MVGLGFLHASLVDCMSVADRQVHMSQHVVLYRKILIMGQARQTKHICPALTDMYELAHLHGKNHSCCNPYALNLLL